MLRWITRFLCSSIGRKIVMAVTGLMLIGFVVVHLVGNLTLYAAMDGSAFDHYAESIDSLPILPLAEAGLALLFLVHIGLAVATSTENRKARPVAYQVRGSHGRKTAASTTMLVTGAALLAFLCKHLWDFRLHKEAFSEAPAETVWAAFGDPLNVIVYVLGGFALGLHLTHAFSSALQTLGFNHPKYTPALRILGIGLGVAVGVGFASFPVVFWIAKGGAH